MVCVIISCTGTHWKKAYLLHMKASFHCYSLVWQYFKILSKLCGTRHQWPTQQHTVLHRSLKTPLKITAHSFSVSSLTCLFSEKHFWFVKPFSTYFWIIKAYNPWDVPSVLCVVSAHKRQVSKEQILNCIFRPFAFTSLPHHYHKFCSLFIIKINETWQR